MAYGSKFIDKIIPTSDLTISSNVISYNNITGANITSGQGRIYPLTSTAKVTTTSGTTVTIATEIPSWVTKINIVFESVSLSGTSLPLFQFGYGSTPTWQTTDYQSAGDNYQAAGGAGPTASSTSGIVIGSVGAATNFFSGIYNLVKIPNTNIWVGGISGYVNGATDTILNGGCSVTLTDTLTAIRLTSVNGTNTFDSGNVCVLYE